MLDSLSVTVPYEQALGNCGKKRTSCKTRLLECGVEEEQDLNEHKAPEATNKQSLVSLWLM